MKRDLPALTTQEFDVLVVGGGIHGALVLWDAALRGLSAALIERGDFGSGTSQNSLKIVHGGLRYLQDGNLSRIRTMARERTAWMRIAPHLVHPLTCLTPTRQKLTRGRPAMGAALLINDLLSFDRNRSMDPQKYLAGSTLISRRELSRLLPGYDPNGSTGAAVWHDAQMYNSERLLLEFLLSAVDEGAQAANYVEAAGFLQKDRRVTGVKARDVLTGQDFEIRAKLVVNCAGAWADGLLGEAKLRTDYATSIAMNITVDQVWSRVAAGLPSRPNDGRPSQILFFVPWRNKTMIGTWHIPWNDRPDDFRLSEVHLRGFIEEINSAHPALRLTVDDVQHVTWGFLPVHSRDAGRQTIRLARDGVVIDHEKRDGLAGLVSVIGVKYTTARAVAEQAVDLVMDKLAEHRVRCQTHVRRVHGGQIDRFASLLQGALSKAPGDMNEEIIEHLVYTYGSDYPHVVKVLAEFPDLRERMDSHLPVTRAELLHGVRHEMAVKLEDVIQRRTELGAAGAPSISVLQKSADVMSRELDWSPDRQQQEIDSVLQKYPIRNTERVAV